MKNRKMDLTAGRKTLAEEKIQRGIFLGDPLLPLLIVIAMIPLNHILKKCMGGDKFTKLQEKINPLMYKDDIKLFVANEKELKTQIQTIRIYSQDLGMEFGIEKYDMFKIRSGKRQITEEIQLRNQERIRALKIKENYKYLGWLVGGLVGFYGISTFVGY